MGAIPENKRGIVLVANVTVSINTDRVTYVHNKHLSLHSTINIIIDDVMGFSLHIPLVDFIIYP